MSPMRRELNLFGEETAERVKRLEEGLARLRTAAPEEREEAVHQLFREAHSLKGAAGLLELASVARLAHAVENLLEPLRAGRLLLDDGLAQALSTSFQWILAYAERLHLARMMDVSREVALLEKCLAEAFARQGKSPG